MTNKDEKAMWYQFSSFTEEQANTVKEALIYGLINEEFLSEEDGKEILENYGIVLRKKGMFGTLLDKVRGTPEQGSVRVELVKFC